MQPGVEAVSLLDLLTARPAWHADAACREHPDLSWHPELGESAGPAKAVCSGCLVRDDCRAYALAGPELAGIWGGLSDRERREARKVRSVGWKGHTAA